MFTPDGIRKFHNWTHASLTLVLNHLSTIPASRSNELARLRSSARRGNLSRCPPRQGHLCD